MSMKVLSPEFFVDGQDAAHMKCLHCKKDISLGSVTPRHQTRVNLTSHLQRKDHFAVNEAYLKRHKEFKQTQDKDAGPKTQKQPVQPTLPEAFERKARLKPGTPAFDRVHNSLLEMLAVDCLPFATTDHSGFRRFVRIVSEGRVEPMGYKYYANRVDQLHDKVVEGVKKLLGQSERYKSGTTDVWTDTGSGVSLLSLTINVVHQGSRKKIVLAPVPLNASHTGQHLKEQLLILIRQWMPPSELVAVSHDNGSNIVKAMRELEAEYGVLSVRCSQHTQQLVITDGLDSQPGLAGALAKCRAIASHFNHSSESRRKLSEFRLSVGKADLVHKSFCETRWDSTWDLVERVLELREETALLAMRKEISLGDLLSDREADLLALLAGHLKVFRSTTKELSRDSASLSVVRPFVQGLQSACTPLADRSDQGIRAMKASQLNSLKTRFGPPCRSLLYQVATLLDPRFKATELGATELPVVQAEGSWRPLLSRTSRWRLRPPPPSPRPPRSAIWSG
jgi:hypothetical protein